MLVIQSAGSNYSPRGPKAWAGRPSWSRGLWPEDTGSLHLPAPLLATPQLLCLREFGSSMAFTPHQEVSLFQAWGKQPVSPPPQLFPFPLSPPWSIGQKKKSMKIGLGRGIEMRNRLSHLWPPSPNPGPMVWRRDLRLLRLQPSLILPPRSLWRTTACSGSPFSSLCLRPALPHCQPEGPQPQREEGRELL